MSVSGKYDFKGIKKAGAAGLKAALASTAFGSVILSGPFGKVTTLCLEFLANLLANQGLVILNLVAITVEGKIDQKAFDSALDQALKKVELNSGKLTPAQMKAIDDEVIQAFRKFATLTDVN